MTQAKLFIYRMIKKEQLEMDVPYGQKDEGMIVIMLSDCPPKVREILSKWLCEINTGVFVEM